jgi:hypothetical protein
MVWVHETNTGFAGDYDAVSLLISRSLMIIKGKYIIHQHLYFDSSLNLLHQS